MTTLDFKEIPEAHVPTGQQDSFELFARDFFEYLGYRIIAQPNRGADGGSDLIIEEIRKGIGGETHVKWLVSCKHKVHSGKSVTPTDEPDINDRVRSKGCQGFIGFYSTLPSSGLAQKLNGLNSDIESQIFDAKNIETRLLNSVDGISLANRYFPICMKLWMQDNPTPANIFDESESLHCLYCGTNLLTNRQGILVTIERLPDYSKRVGGNLNEDYPILPIEILDLYWCCKGECDKQLRHLYDTIYPNSVDAWADIPDLMIPTMYLKWVMSVVNRVYKKETDHRHIYTDKALAQTKKALIEIFPYISRHLTNRELKEIERLLDIPSFLGGLGSSS